MLRRWCDCKLTGRRLQNFDLVCRVFITFFCFKLGETKVEENLDAYSSLNKNVTISRQNVDRNVEGVKS